MGLADGDGDAVAVLEHAQLLEPFGEFQRRRLEPHVLIEERPSIDVHPHVLQRGRVRLHVPGRVEKTVVEHGLVLEAVRSRDAEAAKEHMATHLRNAIHEIRESTGR